MKQKHDTDLPRQTTRRKSILEDLRPFTKLPTEKIFGSTQTHLPFLRTPTPTPMTSAPLSPQNPKRTASSDAFKPIKSTVPITSTFQGPYTPKRASSDALKLVESSQPKPVDISPPKPVESATPRLPPRPKPNIVTRVAYKTRVGRIYGKPKLNNQDSFIIKPGIKSIKGHYLFAVFDGHGTYGHNVSQYIRDNFVSFIEESLDRDINLLSIEKGLYQTSTKLTKGLLEAGIEIAYSGSTLITIMLFGTLCACGNIGDSRAVLGRSLGGEWEALALSQDHTTSRNDERERILNSKGVIRRVINEEGKPTGPERVWIMNEEVPGLAMTRSIGDKISKIIGVTSDPEVILRRLTCDDKFIILASDGVWEHVSSEEAVEIIGGFYEQGMVEEAAVAVVTEALKRWKKEEYVDDITVIVIFLSVNS